MMTKSDTITEIMRLNPTVGAAFLSEFNNQQLAQYLGRLRDLRRPRHSNAQGSNTSGANRSRSERLQTA